MSREHGQSVVEFALVLPFLLLIFMGAIDLSRAFQTIVVVTNASRVGARYGATHPTDTAGIQTRAINEASVSGVTITQFDLACFRYESGSSVSCGSASNGDELKVSLTARFEFATLYLFRLESISIPNDATMVIITGGQAP